MSELPFKLYNKHKTITKGSWRGKGLNMDNFEEIYNKYIYATHCQLCNKQFENTRDRQMEHCHATGKFRNIVCCSCNLLKKDRKQSNNTSGYKGICKQIDKKMKQGFRWVFVVQINNKRKTIKTSIDFEKLVKFAEQWKKDNNYHT